MNSSPPSSPPRSELCFVPNDFFSCSRIAFYDPFTTFYAVQRRATFLLSCNPLANLRCILLKPPLIPFNIYPWHFVPTWLLPRLQSPLYLAPQLCTVVAACSGYA